MTAAREAVVRGAPSVQQNGFDRGASAPSRQVFSFRGLRPVLEPRGVVDTSRAAATASEVLPPSVASR